jgi:PadR family transcriptional regulator, regulatory protein PadR
VPARAALVPGTLDLLILYQALYRLEQRDLLAAEWGASENNRRAKFYQLTSGGRRRLKQETTSWTAFVRAMAAALNADPMEA